MAALYEFEREDGTWVERFYPFGQCPKEIICEDGVKAFHRHRTAPAISWKAGSEPSSLLRKQAESRYRSNIQAGKRGEHEWRERLKF